MEGADGVTAIDTSVADVIVSDVDAETLPKAAVIVVEPVETEVAKPFDPAALLMVATAVADEVQVTEADTSCVDPFE